MQQPPNNPNPYQPQQPPYRQPYPSQPGQPPYPQQPGQQPYYPPQQPPYGQPYPYPQQPGQQPYYPPQQPQMMPPPPKKRRKAWLWIIGIIVVLGLCSIVMQAGQPKSQAATTGQVKSEPTKTNSKPTQVPPTPKPIKKWNVVATSQVIKNVDGQYRYFFDIRNHDTTAFNGSVTIELYNDQQQTPLGSETFNTTKPMEPTFGSLVYFDIRTGPPSIAAKYGITHFKYIVKIEGSQSNSGEGKILDVVTA